MANQKKETYESSKVASIENITVASAVLESLLSLGDRRIRQLTDEGILKRASKGKYDLVESIQNYIKYLRISNDVENSKSKEKLDYDTEKGLNERVKRKQNELKLALMKGELFKSTQIEQVMGDVLTSFRGKMLGLPSKLAPMLVDRQDPGHIKTMLAKEVNEALSELANIDPTDFYDSEYIQLQDDDDDWEAEDDEPEE